MGSVRAPPRRTAPGGPGGQGRREQEQRIARRERPAFGAHGRVGSSRWPTPSGSSCRSRRGRCEARRSSARSIGGTPPWSRQSWSGSFGSDGKRRSSTPSMTTATADRWTSSRGSPEARALLIVETKSDLRNVQETLHALDVKLRVVPRLVRSERGWQADAVGVVMVLADLRVERQRVDRHRSTFDAALPARTVEVRRWLERPAGPLRGLSFLQISQPTGVMREPAGHGRVRRAVGPAGPVVTGRGQGWRALRSWVRGPRGGPEARRRGRARRKVLNSVRPVENLAETGSEVAAPRSRPARPPNG